MVAFQSACSVLSTINLEDEVNILEDIKKRLRDLCSSESEKSEGSLSATKDIAEKDLTKEDHMRIEENLKKHQGELMK